MQIPIHFNYFKWCIHWQNENVAGIFILTDSNHTVICNVSGETILFNQSAIFVSKVTSKNQGRTKNSHHLLRSILNLLTGCFFYPNVTVCCVCKHRMMNIAYNNTVGLQEELNYYTAHKNDFSLGVVQIGQCDNVKFIQCNILGPALVDFLIWRWTVANYYAFLWISSEFVQFSLLLGGFHVQVSFSAFDSHRESSLN